MQTIMLAKGSATSAQNETGERFTMLVKNVDGSGSITTGMGVALTILPASIDGQAVVKGTLTSMSAGTSGSVWLGIANQDIPINSWGMATVWGVANSVMISQVTTSLTVTKGDMLIPSSVTGAFFSGTVTNQALSTQLFHYMYALSSITASTTSWVSAFIKGSL